MSHVGTEKDWEGLVDFFAASREYAPTLKKVMVAQWVYASRRDPASPPGTSDLAVEACNFAGLIRNARMAKFGAEAYDQGGVKYCKFANVEHFIDGYFHFLATGPYDRWHTLAHRPVEFLKYLQDEGFAGANPKYAEAVEDIYEHLSDRFELNIDEPAAAEHVVSHGEFTFAIAEKFGVDLGDVFSLDRTGRVRYGFEIGPLKSNDVLFVITDEDRPLQGRPARSANPLDGLTPCTAADGNCTGRTHFVLHQTVAGNLTRASITRRYGGSRGKGHVYVLKSGETVFLWPFTEKNVRATKAEYPTNRKYQPERGGFPAFPITGKLIHVEIDYEQDGSPNDTQYRTTANLYVQACKIVGRLLTIVPHIEIDRGIKNGHNDPQNFDYKHFYSVLAGLGVDIDSVRKFDHDRYWGRDTYKIPWDTDRFHFPPKLSGNPHA